MYVKSQQNRAPWHIWAWLSVCNSEQFHFLPGLLCLISMCLSETFQARPILNLACGGKKKIPMILDLWKMHPKMEWKVLFSDFTYGQCPTLGNICVFGEP